MKPTKIRHLRPSVLHCPVCNTLMDLSATKLENVIFFPSLHCSKCSHVMMLSEHQLDTYNILLGKLPERPIGADSKSDGPQ